MSFTFKYEGHPLLIYNSGAEDLTCPYCKTLYEIVSSKLKVAIGNLVEGRQFDLEHLIMRCIQCDLYNSDYIFRRDDRFKPNSEQRKTLYELYQEIFLSTQNSTPSKLLMVEGSAGTGKTSLITYFLRYPEFRLFKTCFAAPTNQALNVLVDKLSTTNTSNDQIDLDIVVDNQESDHSEDKPKWEFKTVFKLLNHKMVINASGETLFDSSSSSKMTSKYDITIIDEVSMVEKKQMMDIFNFLASIKRENPYSQQLPTIIFLGDVGQLPPIKEECSIIFDSQIQRQNSIRKWTLTEIMRSQNQITELAIKIRQLIPMNMTERRRIDLPCIDLKKMCSNSGSASRSGNQICVFQDKVKWINQYTQDFTANLSNKNKSSTAPIILTYTNNECELLNRQCRETIFKSPDEKYVAGELLVFNGHYSLVRQKQVTNKVTKPYYLKFYTSQTIIINQVNSQSRIIEAFDLLTIFKSPKFILSGLTRKLSKSGLGKSRLQCAIHDLTKIIDKWTFDVNTHAITTHDQVLTQCLNRLTLNLSKIKHEYDIYLLDIDAGDKLDPDDTEPSHCAITAIKDNCYEKYQTNIAEIKRLIRGTYETLNNSYKQNPLMKTITEYLLQQIWRDYYYQTYIWPFADVSYGYCITSHKSQGSTYYNVYINLPNILGCGKVSNIVKAKSLYTSIGRASHLIRIHSHQSILLPFAATGQSFRCEFCEQISPSEDFHGVNCTFDLKCSDKVLAKINTLTMYKYDHETCVYSDQNKCLYQIPIHQLEDIHINDAIGWVTKNLLDKPYCDRYQYSNLMLANDIIMLNKIPSPKFVS
jgi:hypothetical protein